MSKLVFTNGCFDIIHSGHISLLNEAKSFGEKLVVGINSDSSVKSIKGNDRPINSEIDRATVLLAMEAVDEVRIFEELTPENLIKEIKPDLLVKGGDWNEDEIIGADFVKDSGGKVKIIPIKDGYSTTNILSRLDTDSINKKTESVDDTALASLNNHIEIFQTIIDENIEKINNCGEIIYNSIISDKKILICGNGGSASDAQHIAAEFVGRYEKDRKALAAISLATDTSALTAISNDFGYEKVFSRQLEALANKDDVFIAISTSGNSPNVIDAVMTARKMGCKVIGLTGKNGSKLASLTDECVMVNAEKTSRIQEAHITIGHIWCELLDKKLAAQS